MYDFVGLMPMRHSSSRVKGKNYKEFGNGRPLFYHMAEKLLKCTEIDKVVINTDSLLIKDLCKKDFPQILVIDRPEIGLSPPIFTSPTFITFVFLLLISLNGLTLI